MNFPLIPDISDCLDIYIIHDFFKGFALLPKIVKQFSLMVYLLCDILLEAISF